MGGSAASGEGPLSASHADVIIARNNPALNAQPLEQSVRIPAAEERAVMETRRQYCCEESFCVASQHQPRSEGT